jgi:hypothetical protein
MYKLETIKQVVAAIQANPLRKLWDLQTSSLLNYKSSFPIEKAFYPLPPCEERANRLRALLNRFFGTKKDGDKFLALLKSMNAVVAGGSALSCIFPPEQNEGYDLDVFISRKDYNNEENCNLLLDFFDFDGELREEEIKAGISEEERSMRCQYESTCNAKEKKGRCSLFQMQKMDMSNVDDYTKRKYGNLDQLFCVDTYTLGNLQIQFIVIEFDYVKAFIRSFDMSSCQTFFDYKGDFYTRWIYKDLTLNRVNKLLKTEELKCEVEDGVSVPDSLFTKRVFKYAFTKGFTTISKYSYHLSTVFQTADGVLVVYPSKDAVDCYKSFFMSSVKATTCFVSVNSKTDVLNPISNWLSHLERNSPQPIEEVIQLFNDALNFVSQEERIGNPFKAKFVNLFEEVFIGKYKIIRCFLYPNIESSSKLKAMLELLKSLAQASRNKDIPMDNLKHILMLTGDAKSREECMKLLNFLGKDRVYETKPLSVNRYGYDGGHSMMESSMKEMHGNRSGLIVINCGDGDDKFVFRDDNEAFVARLLHINFDYKLDYELTDTDFANLKDVLVDDAKFEKTMSSCVLTVQVLKEYLKEFKTQALKVRDCKWLVDLMATNPAYFQFTTEDFEQAMVNGIGRDNLFTIKRAIKRQATRELDRKLDYLSGDKNSTKHYMTVTGNDTLPVKSLSNKRAKVSTSTAAASVVNPAVNSI